MTSAPLGSFWAGGIYRGADLIHEWVTSIGYEACHAEQRDWLACEWYQRTDVDHDIPPELVLSWDARCDDLDWVQLAVPDLRPLVQPFERLGVRRHGACVVPAPSSTGPQPDVAAATACGRHLKEPSALWASVSVDLPTLSPLVFEAALLRLVRTWRDLRPVVPTHDQWSSVRELPDFPDLPGWVHDVATANADHRADVFRGTGGVYWTFSSHGTAGPEVKGGIGRPVPDPDAFARWVESTDVPDHAVYERTSPGSAVFMGTFGWLSFYFASPTLEDHGDARDSAMHHAMDLLHLAGKGAPRHHREGQQWRRPLTVVADRASRLAELRYRAPQDDLYVVDEPASAWVTDVLIGRPDADMHLLRRVEELAHDWRVHS